MKKTNKILTRALVILLALVLITSSVVSSTFAKYVVSKEATTKVELQKFGLTVTLEGTDTETVVSQKGDSVTLSYPDITLIPGDDTYKHAINASVSGKASVDAKLYIAVTITCDDERYTITGQQFTPLNNTLGDGKVCNPIEFFVGSSLTDAYSVNTPYDFLTTNNNRNVIKTTIENAIGAKIATNANSEGITASNSGAEVEGTIKAGDEINLENIDIGFVWAEKNNVDDTDCWDEITTWISDRGATTDKTQFTITYTISVEQDTTASN